MKKESKKIDVVSYFWNSLRVFDTINTLCKGLENKCESMMQEHPAAIVDIKTISNIVDMIKIESENALADFTECKQKLSIEQ